MTIPNISASANSQAKSGDAYSSGSQTTGDMSFGGSGSGGGGLGNGFNVGAMVSQFWPIFAVAGAIWWYRRKSK